MGFVKFKRKKQDVYEKEIQAALEKYFFECGKELEDCANENELKILKENLEFMFSYEKKIKRTFNEKQYDLFYMYQFFLFGYLFNREELIERKVKRGEAFSVKSNAAERAIRIIKSRNGQV